MQHEDGGVVVGVVIAEVNNGGLDGGEIIGAGGSGVGQQLVQAVGAEHRPLGGAASFGDAVGVEQQAVTGAATKTLAANAAHLARLLKNSQYPGSAVLA